MANITLVVTSVVEKSYTAYKFAHAAIAAGHTLGTIFFFQQGTTCANGLIDLPGDEPNIQQQWQNLADAYNIGLIACTAAALRRGIVVPYLKLGFKFGSIAQMLQACNAADKVIQL